MLAGMHSEIKRRTQAAHAELSKQRRPLSPKRKFSAVRGSRTHGIDPILYQRKPSERRRAHAHCSTRRRVVYGWLSSLCESTGDIDRLPREQRGTSNEFGLSNLHPAIRIFVNGTTLAASVHYRGRCWDVLECFEHRPGKEAGDGIHPICIPEQQEIHGSVDPLWKAEVFDCFRRWFDLTLREARTLILYGTSDGTTWAQLMPFGTPLAPHEIARFAVWKNTADAVTP